MNANAKTTITDSANQTVPENNLPPISEKSPGDSLGIIPQSVIEGGSVLKKSDRFQTTFVIGSGKRGADLKNIVMEQIERVYKLRRYNKPDISKMLRIAVRLLAKAKDADIVKEEDD